MYRRPASTLDSPATGSANAEGNVIRFDDAPEFSFRQHDDDSMEEMEQQVKEAQRRLADLRAQQEEVERQKQILETLRQKQERFVSGKKEITDRLESALGSILDELEHARRRVEDLALTQKDFEDHLDDLKTYLPERWQRSHLDHELDRALSSLDEAEVSYEKGVHRLMQHRASAQMEPVVMSPIHAVIASHHEAEAPVHSESVLHSNFTGGRDDLVSWARRGLAFNAALISALVLLLILARMMF
jgi:molecular chaperone GrpE (heat shock protein)